MIPLFKSHFSILKSILTLEELGKSKENEPDSIVDIANSLNFKELYLVEDGMSALLPAYLALKKINVGLRYGYRVSFVNDVEDKENPWLGEHKNVIFALNPQGKEDLVRLATLSATTLHSGGPRLDYKTLSRFWTKNLLLAVPFYDSFVYRNNFELKSCIPDITSFEPTFFVEDNDLPFDSLLSDCVNRFVDGKYPIIKTKSIYYKNRDDFTAWQVLKITNRKTGGYGKRDFGKPELPHCSSKEFCVESWRESL